MDITRSLLITKALMVVVTLGAAAQTSVEKLPDTPPGKLLDEWLVLCQGTSVEAMAKWDAAHYPEAFLRDVPAADVARSDQQECRQHGGYQVVHVTEAEPNVVSVIARGNKSGAWVRFDARTKQPGKIEPIGGVPVVVPETALPDELSDAAVKRDVAASIKKLGERGLFSGIVLLARGAEPIAVSTFGYADRSKKTPITSTTRFTLGSMGKMFTSVAVGQLVDQGKLSYDDVVGKFFPGYANRTVREKVTVGMLLSHTGGLGDFLAKRSPEMMRHGVRRASEFMPLYERDEPEFEPGKGWSYSNSGLALAGAIVEEVSGEDYPDYLRRHIFDPLGMKNSDPNNIPHTEPRMVTPYTHQNAQGSPSPDWHEAEHDIGSPAGGAISTAEDLVRFADALRSGNLVSKATFGEMWHPHGKRPEGVPYGYALEIADVYGRTVVGHRGGFSGVSTRLYIILDSRYTIVSLANQDPEAAGYGIQEALALAVEKAKRGDIQ
jgi:CubicO group peptidase (beta-lactamase class C family)